MRRAARVGPLSDMPAPFEQIVFSGGGLRCFWHGGWMSVATDALDLAPRRVTGVSGGALSAAAWIAGKETRLFDRFVRALRRTDSNMTWDDLDDDGGRSVHQRVYDAIVDDVIDADAQKAIETGPAFQVSVSTSGDDTAGLLSALVAGTIYQFEQIVAATPRPRFSSVAGVEQRLIDGNAAARNSALPDLIRMAATIPPAFRPDEWDGEMVYDGGMTNKAPMPEPDEGATLVLLTKRFRTLPDDDGGRIAFVQPSEDVLSGSKLDFTDPDLLHEAWDLGRRDAADWLNRYNH